MFKYGLDEFDDSILHQKIFEFDTKMMVPVQDFDDDQVLVMDCSFVRLSYIII